MIPLSQSVSLPQGSTKKLFFQIPYKEIPQYWTHEKLIDVLSTNNIDSGLLTIIEQHKLSGYELMELSESNSMEIFHSFSDLAQKIGKELNEFYTLQPLSNIDPDMIYMTQSQEVSQSQYQFMIPQHDQIVPDSQAEQSVVDDLSAIHISKIHQTQYSSPQAVSYSFFDYDEYPNFKESLQLFEKLIAIPLFRQSQNEYENECNTHHINLKKEINKVQMYLLMEINKKNLEIEEQNQYTLGSNSTCDIQISKQYISSRHAIITNKNKTFYIQDLGSESGTFISSDQNMPLFQGSIFACGDQQFLIQQLIFDKNKLSASLKTKLIEGVEQSVGNEQEFTVTKGVMSIVGTISKAVLGKDLGSDQKLAKMHAKFIIEDNQLYIQDLNKDKERTWLRLSVSLQQSQQVSLLNIKEFRLGLTRIPITIFQKAYRMLSPL